jgi:threonine/homoserine/homoserine lactone efflux protein
MSVIGIPIGLYGYLFPGNINLMVLDLYASKKFRVLAGVLVLIILFESIYCLLTLMLLGGLKQSSNLYKWLEVGSFILIAGMGIWMLLESRRSKQEVHKNTFYRGIINTIIHPQQIPFWLIIGVVVNPLMKFGMDVFALAGFVIFNAVGTLMAMGIYMVFGNKILQYFNLNLSIINKVMGVVYILLGGYSLIRFLVA